MLIVSEHLAISYVYLQSPQWGWEVLPWACVLGGAEKSHVIVETTLTEPGTKPIFHILDESLCISLFLPSKDSSME